MNHRIVWPVVAALSLAGLVAFLSQSPAQRAPGRPPGGVAEPGMPGMAGPHGMPGRFAVAHASATQVLVLDTATGQVYRAADRDFKPMSELQGPGRPGGRDVRPPARDRGPERKAEDRPRDGRRPPPKDGDERDRRPDRAQDAPPPQREEK